MKQPRNVFAILLIVGILTIGSAGCISLGSQTNEILVGNQTLGTVTLTPTDDLFSLDKSAERVNIDIDLLGDESFIRNLSDADKAELLKTLRDNNLLNISSIVSGTEKDTTADNGADVFSKIMNMKLSSQTDKTLTEAFKMPNMDNAINDAMDSLNKFLESFKF
ncbi:MAG TPA: hypothetical protein O0X27_02875 [Methanocorpusculum sp.]|nr:hypothetical protein [Methanocorpusculum sp.]